MRTGSKGAAVRAVQVQVGVHADGAFGKNTTAAVRAFQARTDLAVDGVVGPRTWNALINGTAPTPGPGFIKLATGSAALARQLLTKPNITYATRHSQMAAIKLSVAVSRVSP
ncbi:peptidoglycan-binding protein [Streptomyces sp. NPDC048330]|uniref:peptidoglycan-binding domain-containing protein n=1 Tax=Streptomyces sp. NPDC048330 TaxID=3365533 RepID=UPI00372346BA